MDHAPAAGPGARQLGGMERGARRGVRPGRDGCMRSLRPGWLAARTIFSNLTEATAEPASYWRASEGGLLTSCSAYAPGCLDPLSLCVPCAADAQRRATLIPVRPTQDGIVNQGPLLSKPYWQCGARCRSLGVRADHSHFLYADVLVIGQRHTKVWDAGEASNGN